MSDVDLPPEPGGPVPDNLTLPFAEPTGYGLGKSGWVSASFGAKDDIPLDIGRSAVSKRISALIARRE